MQIQSEWTHAGRLLGLGNWRHVVLCCLCNVMQCLHEVRLPWVPGLEGVSFFKWTCRGFYRINKQTWILSMEHHDDMFPSHQTMQMKLVYYFQSIWCVFNFRMYLVVCGLSLINSCFKQPCFGEERLTNAFTSQVLQLWMYTWNQLQRYFYCAEILC